MGESTKVRCSRQSFLYPCEVNQSLQSAHCRGGQAFFSFGVLVSRFSNPRILLSFRLSCVGIEPRGLPYRFSVTQDPRATQAPQVTQGQLKETLIMAPSARE